MHKIGLTVEPQMRLETGVRLDTDLAIVERKGWGHPDTMADHLAEELSQVYSRWTLAGVSVDHDFVRPAGLPA